MIHRPQKVLGVLAGRDLPLPRLAEWARSADVVLAADAAADYLVQAGTVPGFLVGDLDSVSDGTRAHIERVIEDEDQETTDCDKLLALAAKLGHASVVLASIEGDRPDHVMVTLASAARTSLDVGLAFRTGIGRIVKPGAPFEIELPPETRLSMIPLVDCKGVSLDGVLWPPKAELSPLGATSVSNRASGGLVKASLEAGAAMLYVESTALSIWSSISLT